MLYKDFPIKKLNNASRGNRKLMHGVGINDSDYQTSPRLDGVKYVCPIYDKWAHMFARCYSKPTHAIQPTYVGCTVDERWHSFMSFREWVLAQPQWEGLHLDKDLLVPGNKVYGPDTCLFVSLDVNQFLTFKQKKSFDLPIGVRPCNKKYVAKVRALNGKMWSSPVCDTKEEAASVYWSKKLECAHTLASLQTDPRVAKAIVDNINLHISLNL